MSPRLWIPEDSASLSQVSAPLTAHGEARASDTRGGGVRHRDAPLCRFARVEGALQSGGWPLPKSPGRTHARVPRLRRSRTTSAIVPRTRCYTVSWKSTSSRSIRRWVSRASRYRRSCTRSSSATCAVVGSSTGRLSQTKYYLSYPPATITIIRRHHPLEGRHLDVLSAGRATVVVSLTDGSSLKLPRRWTDADGIACTDLSGDSPFTLHGLRELLRLFIALRERARGAGSEHDAKIDSPHDGARRVDVQATTIGVHRREAAREWPPDAAGRTCGAASSQSTRHALGTSAPPPKTTPAPPSRRATPRHTTASPPPSAPPRGNDASPSDHGTAPPPPATPHRASPPKGPSRPRPDAALFKDLYRNSSRKSTPKRIRLDIQESQPEQISALLVLTEGGVPEILPTPVRRLRRSVTCGTRRKPRRHPPPRGIRRRRGRFPRSPGGPGPG